MPIHVEQLKDEGSRNKQQLELLNRSRVASRSTAADSSRRAQRLRQWQWLRLRLRLWLWLFVMLRLCCVQCLRHGVLCGGGIGSVGYGMCGGISRLLLLRASCWLLLPHVARQAGTRRPK